MFLYAHLHILSMLSDVVFFINNNIMFVWRPIMTLTIQVNKVIENLLLVIAPLLVEISTDGEVSQATWCISFICQR